MKERLSFQHYSDKYGRLVEKRDQEDNELRFQVDGCVPITNLVDILDTLDLPVNHILSVHEHLTEFITTGGGIADGYVIYRGNPELLAGVSFQTTKGTGKIPVTTASLSSRLIYDQIANNENRRVISEILHKAGIPVIYFVLPNPQIIVTPLHAIGNRDHLYDPVIPYVSGVMDNITDNFVALSNRYRTTQHDPSLELISDIDVIRSSLTEIAYQQTQDKH